MTQNNKMQIVVKPGNHDFSGNSGKTDDICTQEEAAVYLWVPNKESSIEDQKLACLQCAADKGYHLSKDHIYVDTSFAIKNEDHPNFQKMMDDAHRGQFSTIVIHRMDRFTRNIASAVKTAAELDKLGVTLLSAKDNLTLSEIASSNICEHISEQYKAVCSN